LYSAGGELSAELAGRLQGDYVRRDPGKLGFEARVSGRLPATGDWVAASVRLDEGRATIRAVLPRRTEFARKAPWLTTEEQVLAANMDTVFVVSALAAEIAVDDAANVRRLERFLALAHESGAQPVVLLTKADLRDDARQRALGLARLGVHVVVSSSFTGEGLDELEPYLAPGELPPLAARAGASGGKAGRARHRAAQASEPGPGAPRAQAALNRRRAMITRWRIANARSRRCATPSSRGTRRYRQRARSAR